MCMHARGDDFCCANAVQPRMPLFDEIADALTRVALNAGIIGFFLVDFMGVPAPAAIAIGAGLGVAAWAVESP